MKEDRPRARCSAPGSDRIKIPYPVCQQLTAATLPTAVHFPEAPAKSTDSVGIEIAIDIVVVLEGDLDVLSSCRPMAITIANPDSEAGSVLGRSRVYLPPLLAFPDRQC
jgi:hypothetical protein